MEQNKVTVNLIKPSNKHFRKLKKKAKRDESLRETKLERFEKVRLRLKNASDRTLFNSKDEMEERRKKRAMKKERNLSMSKMKKVKKNNE